MSARYLNKKELCEKLGIAEASLPRKMPGLIARGLKNVKVGNLARFYEPNVDDVLEQIFKDGFL